MSAGQWKVAFRNLARNRRRNLATGIAIGLGFAALLALGGYINRVENYLRVYTIYGTRVGHLTVYKEHGLERYSVKPKQYSLTADELKLIKELVAREDNVQLHGAQLQGAGLIGNGCRTVPFIATGIEPWLDKALREHPELKEWAPKISFYTRGRGLWEYPPDLGAIAIADGLARLLHKPHVHDDLPPDQKPVLVVDCLAPDAKKLIEADANVQLAAGSWSGMMSALDGEIVAEYNTGVTETQNSAIVTALSHLQKLYDTENATFYSIWLRNAYRLPKTMEHLKERFAEEGLKVDVYPWTDEAISPMYAGTMNFLYTMVAFISVVLATVVVFSIFNAATMTVIERSQEIGMMRSLGFTRRQIRQLFVYEMLALSSLAVVAGGVVGAAGIAAVNAAKIRLNPPGVAGGMQLALIPNAGIVAGAAVLIFLLSVLTTLMAVRTVAKRNIATLLMGTQR